MSRHYTTNYTTLQCIAMHCTALQHTTGELPSLRFSGNHESCLYTVKRLYDGHIPKGQNIEF